MEPQLPPQPAPTKKANSFLFAFLGILAAAAVVFSAWFWKNEPTSPLPAGPIVSPRPTAPEIPESPSLCPTDSIKQFGEVNTQSDIIVYSTECVLKTYGNNSTDSLMRFYVRDALGTFNRKIYEVLNKSEFGGSTYAQIIDEHGGKIKIHRVKNDQDSVIIDVFGKEQATAFPEEQLPEWLQTVVSPNKKYAAFSLADTNSGVSKNIRVKNLESGQSKDYNFSETGLNGAYIADWSEDSATLYIMGGIWEFSAPAKLWSINISQQTVKEYKGLEDFTFPVRVVSKRKIALLSNNSPSMGMDENSSSVVSLYSLDLQTEKKTLIKEEKASWAFSPTVLVGDNIFYGVSPTEQRSEIKKAPLNGTASSVVYSGSLNLYETVVDDEWLLINDNGRFRIFSGLTGEEKFIGQGSPQLGFAVPRDGAEYVQGIVGVLKK